MLQTSRTMPSTGWRITSPLTSESNCRGCGTKCSLCTCRYTRTSGGNCGKLTARSWSHRVDPYRHIFWVRVQRVSKLTHLLHSLQGCHTLYNGIHRRFVECAASIFMIKQLKYNNTASHPTKTILNIAVRTSNLVHWSYLFLVKGLQTGLCLQSGDTNQIHLMAPAVTWPLIQSTSRNVAFLYERQNRQCPSIKQNRLNVLLMEFCTYSYTADSDYTVTYC